mmetsp:Transcript_39644/g.99658  ORF Transcript_39644/g.99658 Transcript_39644/m.99658 type:complete len:359 (-) Transcript_39644:1125-2201(-)
MQTLKPGRSRSHDREEAGRQLVDAEVEKGLHVLQHALVLPAGDEVDRGGRGPLAALDALHVVLRGVGQVVVDGQQHAQLLLHPRGVRVGGNQQPGRDGCELVHVQELGQGHDDAVPLLQLRRDPIRLLPAADKDHALRRAPLQQRVARAQALQLLLLAAGHEVELRRGVLRVRAAGGEQVDVHRVRCKAANNLLHLRRHGRARDRQLHVRRAGRGRCPGCGLAGEQLRRLQEVEHVVHGLLEAALQHLVHVLQHQHLDGACVQDVRLEHVPHVLRRADHHCGAARLQRRHVLGAPAAARMRGGEAAVEATPQRRQRRLRKLPLLAARGQQQGLAAALPRRFSTCRCRPQAVEKADERG